MTVAVQTPFASFIATGSATFAYSFKVNAAADLVVKINGATQASSLYSVTGLGTSAGSVVFISAPTVGAIVSIQRKAQLQRTTDYQNNGDFLAGSVNPDFDNLWMALQDQQYQQSMALQISPADIVGVNTTLPTPVGGTVIGWDALGKNLVNFVLNAGTSLVNLAMAAGSSLIGFIQSGVGAILRTIQDELRETVKATQFGADPTGATNSTAAFAAAVTWCLANGKNLRIPAGNYVGVISVRGSNISITGDGSAVTKITTPAGVDSITLEVGNTALGNGAPAYTNITVNGLTLDGNYANVPVPATDLTGHAFIATNASYCTFGPDLICQNAQVACMDIVINSNYNHVEATCINGGNANVPGNGYYPNFDINSSKYGNYKILSQGGKYGGRMLDNCFGNTLHITSYSPSYTGFVYNNQSVNQSYANTIVANVVGGCTFGQGVSIGVNCHSSTITANIYGVVGTGYLDVGGANPSSGNTVTVNSYNCGGAGAVPFGSNNIYTFNSYLDGRTGGVGSYFAVDINGSYNTINAAIYDSATPQVRGIAVRAGATNNNIVSYTHNTNVQAFLMQDTSNTTAGYPTSNFLSTNSAVGTRVAAGLSGGWSNTYGAPFAVAAYALDATGTVRLFGNLTGGTGTAFTLPAGYRPNSQILLPTTSNSGAGCTLQITTAGAVSVIFGTATGVVLDGLSFPTLI